MHPSLWSAAVWRTMHCVALGYPGGGRASELQKAAYRNFFVSLAEVIPCATCSRGYGGMLAKGALPALDRALDHVGVGDGDEGNALFKWTVDVHNAVGRRTGGKVWSVRRARAEILGDAENPLPPPPSTTGSACGSQSPPETRPTQPTQPTQPQTAGRDGLIMYPAIVLSIALCIGFLAAFAFVMLLWGGWALLCRMSRSRRMSRN